MKARLRIALPALALLPSGVTRAQSSAHDGGAPAPTRRIPHPASLDPDRGTPLVDRLEELLPGLPSEGIELSHLLLALVALLLTDVGIRRVRDALRRDGALPLALAIVHVTVRLSAFFVALAVPALLASPALAPLVLWILLAAGAALGWTARDVLPDLLAGLVLLFERRLRRGMWIAGEGFAGTVTATGLRSTWLRDRYGHRVGVPNRKLIEVPLVADPSGDTEQEVTLRLPSRRPAGELRLALRDAVLSSPWVVADCRPVVLRDPVEPHVWRVRARLLESRFATRFEGELLERAEAILAHGARAAPEPDAPDGEG